MSAVGRRARLVAIALLPSKPYRLLYTAVVPSETKRSYLERSSFATSITNAALQYHEWKIFFYHFILLNFFLEL